MVRWIAGAARMTRTWRAIALIALMVAGTTMSAEAVAPAQTLAYTLGSYEPNNPTASRSLIFDNNPEALANLDMANLSANWVSGKGPAVLSVQLTNGGRYRDFFEHSNNTSYSTIGFGFFFYNNGATAATLTIMGKGTATSVGGQAFTQLFSNYGSGGTNYSVSTIPAGGSKWIHWGSGTNFSSFTGSFSGVMDFQVSGGQLLLRHVAYTSFSGMPSSYNPMGYVKRIDALKDGGTQDQRRVYKGVSPYTAAVLQASYTIDSSDVGTATTPKPLAVKYTDFNGTLQTGTSWRTSIDKGHRATAIGSDMLSFVENDDPAVPTFSATTNDASGAIANLGNWGVVYKTVLTVTNNSGGNRTIHFRFAPPASGATIQAGYFTGTSWTASNITSAAPFTYYSKVIPSGTTVINAYFVIGAPSYADLIQSIAVS